SFFDGQLGFRCNHCGLALAPARGWLARTAMLGVPCFAVLFGLSLVAAALYLFLHDLPFGHYLGFGGVLAVGAGAVSLHKLLPEFRTPRPKQLDQAEKAGMVLHVPLPRRHDCPSPPTPRREPNDPAPERLCHFHCGPEGVASGLGGFFLVYLALVVIGSLIL